jgi:hypothetical protein
MIVEAQMTISGSKAAVWAAITNIEMAAAIISGIEKIEIVERPANELVGLRWRETRTLFGKLATVEKSITDATDTGFVTRAEDGGFVFLTTNCIAGSDGGVTLTSSHETRPQGFLARLKAMPMCLFKGLIRKAILQDLTDIKAAVERGSIAVVVAPPHAPPSRAD